MRKTKHENWYWIAKGFIKIADGLTPILSLGFFWTDWEYKFTKWKAFTYDQAKNNNG